ncbi:hypothetical protein HMPREF1621_02597 [Escherichia coli A25922R]|uniref:Uncharacterized protein n=4 Tax=Escherichia coli TaxID=562 RepID=A0A0H2VAX4_ECOL6|nr:Hypothetical protein c3016 [Escherichia coli CFT073]AER85361.1 hypothetical protein i02_2812 [Escherichia coli str. 'clone D i2']AER90280.1 hypothetical protein i14_2812 [Escherichia coli str. 'clone D i14']EEJ46344.1 hypothetical protein HMPREF0358_4120 [Escherichia coli 83972]EFJ92418.1 hypothetical protein HMPREF9531_02485 [Escherichia coli MS 45-1]ESE33824.1 hypothetical protein HMPREF1621_02597 [Escherichia coli A25922R]KEJ10211.1 hypothetical protein AD07_2692 [Escherichia coli 8-415
MFDEWVFDFHDLHTLSPLRGSHKKNRRIIPPFFKAAILFSLTLVKTITVLDKVILYSNGYERRLFHPKTILCPGTSILSPRAWGKDVQKGCVKQSRKRLLSLLELRRILFFYRK